MFPQAALVLNFVRVLCKCGSVDRLCAWHDAGENEGLGGLVAVVEKDVTVKQTKTEEGDESQEHLDRRYALLDRDDPRLAELDAMVAEVKEHAPDGTYPYATWREDVQMAEHIFLETPDELPAWLDRMRIKNMSKERKLERVLELAEQLVKDAIIAIPPGECSCHSSQKAPCCDS